MTTNGWGAWRRSLNTPAFRLGCVLLLGGLATAAALLAVLRQPDFGLTLQPGMTLASSAGRLTVTAADLIPEPGGLPSYGELDSFYARQDRLADILAGRGVTLTTTAPVPVLAPGPRTFIETPLMFWVQAAVGFGALLISGWVWALRPRDLASRLFALSGVATLGFTLSAAIYSTRTLALPVGLFEGLVLTNLVGASLFGIAMIGLFLVYPRRLSLWRPLMAANVIIFGGWTLAAALSWLPSAQFGGNLITLVEMVFIVVAIGAQHRATRGQPQSRAALTWLGLSVLIGAGAFILLNAVPAVLGLAQPLEQGLAFLFFLIIYIGLAAGLRRYRLFDVGQWGLWAMFYAVGAVLLLMLDGALLLVFGLDQAPAFGLAILAVSLLYLPLRDQLWRWTTKRRPVGTHDMLAAALDVAFAPSSARREARWTALLKRSFDPLAIEPAETPVAAPQADADGVSLLLPPVAGAPSLKLSYPWGGRGLFKQADLDLAIQLVALTTQAEHGRQAYDRGVTEERRRMAQDLHDDVGARLLTGLHMATPTLRPTLQAAISDIRAIVSGITGERASLERLLGDARYEAVRRLEGVGLTLDWPLAEAALEARTFDYRQHKAFTSAVREVVSNVIRHAGATRLEVQVTTTGQELVLVLRDDGKGLSPQALSGEAEGYGLRSLKRRMADIGGRLEITSGATGTQVRLAAPFDLPIAAAEPDLSAVAGQA